MSEKIFAIVGKGDEVLVDNYVKGVKKELDSEGLYLIFVRTSRDKLYIQEEQE